MSYLARINAQKAHSRCRMHGMASIQPDFNQGPAWDTQQQRQKGKGGFVALHPSTSAQLLQQRYAV